MHKVSFRPFSSNNSINALPIFVLLNKHVDFKTAKDLAQAKTGSVEIADEVSAYSLAADLRMCGLWVTVDA